MAQTGAAAVIFWVLVAQCMLGDLASAVDDNNEKTTQQQQRVPSQCTLVMAPSLVDSESAGWGVFSMTDREPGAAVSAGDIVIQVADMNATHGGSMKRLAFDYAWNAAETGGQYEGQHAVSLIPGLGMLANGSPQNFNILPGLEPTVDEAGATRQSSPGAGAFSHYHNFSFYATHPISAGSEILVNYGQTWFEQLKRSDGSVQKERRHLQQSIELLQETGFCLDNIHPADSKLPNAGRGAFASRDLASGAIVAPVPVVPITKRQALDVSRLKQISQEAFISVESKQLLLNYVLGHPKSSVLLFPYSPLVNLINHAPSSNDDGTFANVRLQWSSASQPPSEQLSLDDLERINADSKAPAGLLMELVALTEIKEGEEIVMDYGRLWEEAWNKHVTGWNAYEKQYAPAYAMDEETPIISTQAELQKGQPYPPNVITSCFYRYHQDDPSLKRKGNPARNITTADWTLQPGIFELRNLRPCTVMQRVEVDTTTDDSSDDEDKEPDYYYSVVIRNRYGLPEKERVLTGHVHIASRVPRR